MKKLQWTFLAITLFASTAMAADIAFYVGRRMSTVGTPSTL